MNLRFLVECGGCSEIITDKACLNELDVYFIIQAESDTAIGYVALAPLVKRDDVGTPEYSQASSKRALPILAQIYVEPDYRRRGVAFAALRVVLAGCRTVAVGMEVPGECERLLGRLGLQAVGSCLEAETGDGQILQLRHYVDANAHEEQNCNENAG